MIVNLLMLFVNYNLWS